MQKVFFTLMGVVLAGVAVAQSRFLVAPAEPAPVTSCVAPEGMVPVMAGLQPLDTYIARVAPDRDADYALAWYTANDRLELVQDYLVTTDAQAADICARLEAGDTSPETSAAFTAALDAGAYWWAVRAPQNPNYYEDDPFYRQDTAYIGASYVSFQEGVLPEGPLGKLEVGSRMPAASIVELSDQDTTHARALAVPDARAVWETCHIGHSLSELTQSFRDDQGNMMTQIGPETLDELLVGSRVVNGVWSGCRRDYGENGEFEDMLSPIESIANCPAFTVDGNDLDAESVLGFGITALGRLPERFAVLCPQTVAEQMGTFCGATDHILFNALFEQSNKVVSICQSGDQVTYSFGHPGGQPELSFTNPVDKIVLLSGESITMANGDFLYSASRTGSVYGELHVYKGTVASDNSVADFYGSSVGTLNLTPG